MLYYARCMLDLDTQQTAARQWFEALRTRICSAFETIEREAGSDAAFVYTPWQRDDNAADTASNSGADKAGPTETGGGVRGQMNGVVFEKVGVNVSTVAGQFAPEFAKSIHGAGTDNPGFFATGISLVAHMANPHAPAVHMNFRFLNTSKRWFGGGADLNPPIPYDTDTTDFHAHLRAACDAHRDIAAGDGAGPGDYAAYKKWADDYFYIPHRGVHRGVGGIFYDHVECSDDASFERNFAFTRAAGEAFLDIFPALVRRRMGQPFTDADRQTALIWRGRYAEFNLVYDRGTTFGLKTGGNIEAILMSLPPLAKWV
jgi:coproporphyrinogen III oxidase